VTRVPAVDGISRDHKLRPSDGITDDLDRKMAARVAPHASRLPAPDPPSTNSAWHQQLYGARTAADYDRGRRQVTWSNDDGSPPVGGVPVNLPRTAIKDRSGYAQSWCTQKSPRQIARVHS
jgi:hypothetical protein